MKRLRQVTWLLIVALLITLFTACHYHPGNRAGKQSSEINWEDSAYNRFAEAEQLYNNNMHDSLMAVAPGVLEFPRSNSSFAVSSSISTTAVNCIIPSVIITGCKITKRSQNNHQKV